MINKKNSILFNQEWINKVIEEGRMDLLPYKKLEDGTSIGEFLEAEYRKKREYPKAKVTSKNSLLYDKEWTLKFKEEHIQILKYTSDKYSLGEHLADKYFRLQMIKNYKKTLKKCK